MIKTFVFLCCSLSVSAQYPPRYAFSPTLKNEVRSIEGSVKDVAPDGWSTTQQTFGSMPDMGLGEGYNCAYIQKKMHGKEEGFEETYFAFKVYRQEKADTIFQKAKTRRLHPWLNLPQWSSFKEGAIHKPLKTRFMARMEYRPPQGKVRRISFPDQVFVAPLNEDVLVAYFYGGTSRKRQEHLFFQLLGILKNGYQKEAPAVVREITPEDILGTQPKTLEEALVFLNKWMSTQEKDAVLAAWGKKPAPAAPVPLVDGSMLSPYLVPFENGRCSWEDWISRHWGLANGDSPLARFLELKGIQSGDEMVAHIMKSFHSYLAASENSAK